jgi:hypothetical protein
MWSYPDIRHGLSRSDILAVGSPRQSTWEAGAGSKGLKLEDIYAYNAMDYTKYQPIRRDSSTKHRHIDVIR